MEPRTTRFWYSEPSNNIPSIDMELVSLIGDIHEYKVKQDNILNRQSQQLEKIKKTCFYNSVTDSNKIESITSTPERIKALIEGTATPQTEHEEEILGYIEALRHVYQTAQDSLSLTSQQILELHKILYKYSSTKTGGKLKVNDNSIVGIDSRGCIFEVFRPLAAAETPQALEDLLLTFNHELSKGQIDPLILIPMFVHDFLCIHPFADGNGRISRLLTELLLVKCGYHISKYISIDSYVCRYSSFYYSVLNESSENWHEQKNNSQPFVKFLLRAIASSYSELDKVVGYKNKNKSSLEAVREAVRLKIKFKKQDVFKALPHLSRSTIENMLYQLIADNYLKRCGQGRATFYLRNLD